MDRLRWIERERKRAHFWAMAISWILPLSPLFFIIYYEITEPGIWVFWMMLLVATHFIPLLLIPLTFLLQHWMYRFVFAIMTPARIKVLWLRRFNFESGKRYRPSRDIDRLGADGISVFTLQDPDVKLSKEQIRDRHGPTMMLVTACGFPFAFHFAELHVQRIFENNPYTGIYGPSGPPDLQGVANELIMAPFLFFFHYFDLFLKSLPVYALYFSVLVILALGFTLAIWSPLMKLLGFRNDFARLKSTLTHRNRGRYKRGAVVFKIHDDHWREAVLMGIKNVDAVIFDLSEMTEHMRWELDQVLNLLDPSQIVFIARQGQSKSNNLAIETTTADARLSGIQPLAYDHFAEAPSGPKSDRFFKENIRNYIHKAVDNQPDTQNANQFRSTGAQTTTRIKPNNLLLAAIPFYVVLFPLLPLYLWIFVRWRYWLTRDGVETVIGGERVCIRWSDIDGVLYRPKGIINAASIILTLKETSNLTWKSDRWRGLKVTHQKVRISLNWMNLPHDDIAQRFRHYHLELTST